MTSEQIYKTRTNDKITIRLNSKYYFGTLGTPKHIEGKDLFTVKVKWIGKGPEWVSHGAIDVEIIYKNDKVFHSLISPSV